MSAWRFIQSEYFGEILAARINKTISNETDFDLTFTHLEIDMFPPATFLKNVSFKNKSSKSSKLKLDVTAGSISLGFGLSNFFSNKLSIDRVGLEDANVLIEGISQTQTSGPALKYQDIFPKIKKALTNSLPVRIGGVHLKRTYVESKFATGYFENLDATLYKKVLETNIRAHKLVVSKEIIKDPNYNNLDYIQVDFHLDEKKLLLKKSELWKDTQKAVLDGALLFKKNDRVSFDGSIYVRGLIEKIDYLNSVKELKEVGLKGVYELKTDVVTNLDSSVTLDGSVRVLDLKSEYANLDSLYTEFNLSKSVLSLENTFLEKESGSVKLNNKVSVFNIETNQLLNQVSNITVNDFHTNHLLYALREDLEILKGKVSGDIDVAWDGNEVLFTVNEGATLKKFTLVEGESTPILQNEHVNIDSGEVRILENLDVGLKFDLRVGERTNLKADALITTGKIDVTVQDSYADFAEVGPISGVGLIGHGPFSMTILGGGSDVNFDFNIDLKEAELLDYYLGDFKSSLSLNLDDLILTIKKGRGGFNRTKYKSDGFIDFENSKINLTIDVEHSDKNDAIKMLSPISKNIDFLHSKYLGLEFKSKVRLSGGLSPDELKVYGVVDGNELIIFQEKSEAFSFNFNFADSVLVLDRIKVRHGTSDFRGKFSINTKSEYFEYDAKLLSGQIEDLEAYRLLNLGFSSEVNGEFYGNGTLDDFSTRSHLRFINSFLGNVQVPESLVTVYNNSKEIFSSGNYLGDRITFNLYLNLDETVSQKSYINSFFNFRDIKELVSVISNHNMQTRNISGSLKGNLSTSFSLFDLSNFSLKGNMTEFNFVKGDRQLFIDGNNASLEMKDGEVTNVNFRLMSNSDDFFTLSGNGSLDKKIELRQNFKLDASFLSLLSNKISKSAGILHGEGRVYGNIDKLDYDYNFFGKNIFLKMATIPSSFSNVSFNLVLDDRSLFLNELNGLFGKGEIEGSGVVKLTLPYPIVDLSLGFKNSYLPLFKKSGVLLSGQGKIEGSSFPYLLNGSLTVLNGTINDEIQDLSPPSVSGNQGHQKYVPENKYNSRFDYFDLDVLLDFDKPIVVRNLLTDLRLIGNGRIKGQPSKPVVNGTVEVVPGLSKLLFKGNEFIIKEGSLSFTEDKGLVPELNFNGTSRINQYNVNLDVYGMANDPQLSVTADPFLNQEDIFSLLTLGFTSEISDELEEKDLRSATTLGIGTLLFDQLLKNQGLSSNLGLKLSVLPEFEEDESSLLKGKSGVSESGSSRYKTATKIKLEKKVSKNVDLSLASTVGGSAEQKQEMNINYNVIKNVSLEGVYEINSSSEDQSEEPTSFGVDLKIQWSY
jgi:translocation and assembly module TamB